MHPPQAVRRLRREILPHALPAFATYPLAKEVLQKAYHPVRPHDTMTKFLSSPHGVLSEAAEPIVATFEVRRGRKVVVDEEADLPHTVCQEAKIPPSLVLFPAPIREHVYAGRPAFISSGSGCFAPISAQVVSRDPGRAVQVKIAVVNHVLRCKDPRLRHVHPAAPQVSLRGNVDDCYHERRVRVNGHNHADGGLVGVLLGEIFLDDKVAVLERLQATPVAVPLTLGSRMMSHVNLAVFFEHRPQLAESTLFGNGLVRELLGCDLSIC